MTVIEIPQEVDRFVLYFDTPKHSVNAYALASALIGLSDAVMEANAAVNPGYRVEVVVEALSDGSFQAVVRTVYERARNLFSNEAVKAIVYGIISTHIYETSIKTETPPTISVSKEMVVIQSGTNKIIVPRDVYEAKKQLEKSERFTSAIGQVFHGVRIPSKLDSHSTSNWTRIPRQTGQSARSDAGVMGFTPGIPFGSSVVPAEAHAFGLSCRPFGVRFSVIHGRPPDCGSFISRQAGGRRWVTRREGHGAHCGLPFLRSDSPSRSRVWA